MIELPISCEVNKTIFKNKIFERAALNTSAKNEIKNIVDKIIWRYKISERTINTDKTESVEEIQIFRIVLKERMIPEATIRALTKAIPYKIIFEVVFGSQYCYILFANNRIWATEWNIELPFKLSGLNLSEVYDHFVKLLINDADSTENTDELLERRSKIATLEQELESLKRKMNSEPQFDKKIEYHRMIAEKQSELTNLKGDTK